MLARAVLFAGGLTLASFVDQSHSPDLLTPGRLVVLAGGGQIPTSMLIEGVKSGNPRVRAVAARIAATYVIVDLRPHIESALTTETDPVAGAELIRTLLFFGRAEATPLVQPHADRLGGEARLPIYEWQARTEPERLADDLPAVIQRLGDVEARRLHSVVALLAATLERPTLLTDFQVRMQRVPPKGDRLLRGDLPISARLLSPWLPGLFESAAGAAGCELSEARLFGYVRQTLRPDGRPSQIAIDASRLPKACAAVLAGLGQLSFADVDRPLPKDLTHWLVLPFTVDFARCAPPAPYLEPHDPALKPVTPKKLKDVRPVYPEDMQTKRVQGTVQIDATISDGGCIPSARVVRTPALALSLAALQAVSGWTFEPTVIDGTAVAASMTLTVNFTLR